MISAALKYGTTEYMRPHPDQMLHGWIEAPRFQEEEDHNLALMLLTSMERYEENIPKLKKLRYNFESRRFETKDGKPFTARDFDALAETAPSRDAGGGRTTLARVVFSRSLVNGGRVRSASFQANFPPGFCSPPSCRKILGSILEKAVLGRARRRDPSASSPKPSAPTVAAKPMRKQKQKAAPGLTYQQWVQVKTPALKAWFGDWENDPENASKVVDPDTGEPRVVYHGSPSRPWRIEEAHLASA